METGRARNRKVLPRQHPITSKGNLLSSSSEETIRRWVGATFSGRDMGGHFATRKSGSVAHWLVAPTRWYALRKTSGAQRMAAHKFSLGIPSHSTATATLILVWLATATFELRSGLREPRDTHDRSVRNNDGINSY